MSSTQLNYHHDAKKLSVVYFVSLKVARKKFERKIWGRLNKV